jgi:hypothetical protein
MMVECLNLSLKYLPDVADLIAIEINFEDNGKFSEGGFRKFCDFIALLSKKEER